MIGSWPSRLPDGGVVEELAVTYDEGRDARLLIIPPLFDDANKMRRFLAEVGRRLNLAGIDAILPDLPGCNESSQSLAKQDLNVWRDAVAQLVAVFSPTHCLAVRSGAMLMPADLPGWAYTPQSGAKLLRGMMRARILASRENGVAETTKALTKGANRDGIALSGWRIGAAMFGQLQHAAFIPGTQHTIIEQTDIGGAGLWLRAEPNYDGDQADALAAIVAMGMMVP